MTHLHIPCEEKSQFQLHSWMSFSKGFHIFRDHIYRNAATTHHQWANSQYRVRSILLMSNLLGGSCLSNPRLAPGMLPSIWWRTLRGDYIVCLLFCLTHKGRIDESYKQWCHYPGRLWFFFLKGTSKHLHAAGTDFQDAVLLKMFLTCTCWSCWYQILLIQNIRHIAQGRESPVSSKPWLHYVKKQKSPGFISSLEFQLHCQHRPSESMDPICKHRAADH